VVCSPASALTRVLIGERLAIDINVVSTAELSHHLAIGAMDREVAVRHGEHLLTWVPRRRQGKAPGSC
jgi:hypothetical protein